MGQEAQDVIRSLKEDYAISSSLKQYAERYRVLSNLISPCSSFYRVLLLSIIYSLTLSSLYPKRLDLFANRRHDSWNNEEPQHDSTAVDIGDAPSSYQ